MKTVLALAGLDPAGGVAEDHAGLLAGGEQRSQGGQGVDAPGAVQGAKAGGHVFAGDLAQVVMAG
jgi:hypothetical protein